MDDPKIIRENEFNYPGQQDDILIHIGDVIIKVDIPLGHSAEDISVQYTTGDGYKDVEQK